MRIQGFEFEIVGADERVRKYLDKVDNPLPKGKTYRSLSDTLFLWQNGRMNKRQSFTSLLYLRNKDGHFFFELFM